MINSTESDIVDDLNALAAGFYVMSLVLFAGSEPLVSALMLYCFSTVTVVHNTTIVTTVTSTTIVNSPTATGTETTTSSDSPVPLLPLLLCPYSEDGRKNLEQAFLRSELST